MIFYLGLEEVSHLERVDVPAFVSRNRLIRLKDKLPRARAPWACDSGGFTTVTERGGWTVTPQTFVAEVEFWSREIGGMDWCAPMDFMVEAAALARTGLTVRAHQELTTYNYLHIQSASRGHVQFIPVLQGDTVDDYLRHIELYAQHGVDLAYGEQGPRKHNLVGVGSICRRQGAKIATDILRTLAEHRIFFHAFGLSTQGVQRACQYAFSSDSQAWSKVMRDPWKYKGDYDKSKRVKGPSRGDRVAYALGWRAKLLTDMPAGCVTIHPQLWTPAERALFERSQAVLAPQAKPRRAKGARTLRELEVLLRAVDRVATTNAILDEEEAVEDARGAMLGDLPMPATYRAVLDPPTKAALASLTPEEWSRLGTQHRPQVEAVLAQDDGGPWPPALPPARAVPKLRPRSRLAKARAHLRQTLRRLQAVKTCVRTLPRLVGTLQRQITRLQRLAGPFLPTPRRRPRKRA